MMERVVRRVRNAHRTGWARSVRIAVDRAALMVLQKVYGFHPWHAAAPLSVRPYRHVVASIVATLEPKPSCVVEVGCGLGSLLSLVDAVERVGYDVDLGALRAARLVHGRRATFIHGDMTAVTQPRIDVLILVNWIHDFSPERLDEWLTPLLPRTRYLLVDAIDADDTTGYRFKHDFSFLEGRVREVHEGRAVNEGRRFLLYEVLR